MRAKTIIAIFMAFFLILQIQISSAEDEREKSSFKHPIDITGDYIEYEKGKKSIHGKGNIVVDYGSLHLECDEAFFDLEKRIVEAYGNVLVADGKGKIYGDKIVYDLDNKKGVIDNSTISFEPWYAWGPRIHKLPENKVVVERGYFTTCDLDRPHYRMVSRKVKIYQDDKIIAYNVFLYIGNVPVFYFPIYVHSLGKEKVDLSISVGYSDTLGYYAKLKYGIPLSEFTQGRLYLDYMSYKGWGFGAKYEYDIQDQREGSVYGYFIKERDTGKIRWKGDVEHWQRLTPTLYTQADLNYVSTQDFNWDYARGEDYILRPTYLKSRLALTKKTENYTARIYGFRRDIVTTEKDFIAEEIYAPGLSLLTNTRQIFGSSVYYTLSIKGQNYYNLKEDFYKKSADGDFNLNTNMLVNRAFILNTKAGFNQSWEDRTSKLDRTDVYKNYYYTRPNLRTMLSRDLRVDLGHDFKQALKGRVDSGVETSKGLFGIYYRLGWFFDLSTKSGFDILGYKNRESHEGWKEYLDPIQSRIDIMPSYGTKLYFSHSYDVFTKANQRLGADCEIEQGELWSFRTRLNYLKSSPGRIDVTNRFGFWLTGKWWLDFEVRYDVFNDDYRVTDVEYKEKKLSVYRDLHCWEAEVSWVKKPSREEVWIMFNLKAYPDGKIGVYHQVEDDEWQLKRGF